MSPYFMPLIKAATPLGFCLSFQHQEEWMTMLGKQKLNERCLQEPVSDCYWRGTRTAMGTSERNSGKRNLGHKLPLWAKFSVYHEEGWLIFAYAAFSAWFRVFHRSRPLSTDVGSLGARREVTSSADRLWAPEVKCVHSLDPDGTP